MPWLCAYPGRVPRHGPGCASRRRGSAARPPARSAPEPTIPTVAPPEALPELPSPAPGRHTLVVGDDVPGDARPSGPGRGPRPLVVPAERHRDVDAVHASPPGRRSDRSRPRSARSPRGPAPRGARAPCTARSRPRSQDAAEPLDQLRLAVRAPERATQHLRGPRPRGGLRYADGRFARSDGTTRTLSGAGIRVLLGMAQRCARGGAPADVMARPWVTRPAPRAGRRGGPSARSAEGSGRARPPPRRGSRGRAGPPRRPRRRSPARSSAGRPLPSISSSSRTSSSTPRRNTSIWNSSTTAKRRTIPSSAEGNTLTPRTTSMSSTRPRMPPSRRANVRPHAHAARAEPHPVARAVAQDGRAPTGRGS